MSASKRTPPKTPPADDDIVVQDADVANRPYLDDDGPPPKETRAEKKRKATQLERLGETLVKLADPKLARVPMPDELREAVVEAKRISAHGGYRRQIQYIGRVMRNVDAQPIAAALEALRQEDAPSSAAFRAAETWRDRLIAGTDDDVEALLGAHPTLDRTHVRQLVRQAQKERKASKPPHAMRALFRELRTVFLG